MTLIKVNPKNVCPSHSTNLDKVHNLVDKINNNIVLDPVYVLKFDKDLLDLVKKYDDYYLKKGVSFKKIKNYEKDYDYIIVNGNHRRKAAILTNNYLFAEYFETFQEYNEKMNPIRKITSQKNFEIVKVISFHKMIQGFHKEKKYLLD